MLYLVDRLGITQDGYYSSNKREGREAGPHRLPPDGYSTEAAPLLAEAGGKWESFNGDVQRVTLPCVAQMLVGRHRS